MFPHSELSSHAVILLTWGCQFCATSRILYANTSPTLGLWWQWGRPAAACCQASIGVDILAQDDPFTRQSTCPLWEPPSARELLDVLVLLCKPRFSPAEALLLSAVLSEVSVPEVSSEEGLLDEDWLEDGSSLSSLLDSLLLDSPSLLLWNRTWTYRQSRPTTDVGSKVTWR